MSEGEFATLSVWLSFQLKYYIMCANLDGKTNYIYAHLLNISNDTNLKYVAAVATTADILEKSFVI